MGPVAAPDIPTQDGQGAGPGGGFPSTAPPEQDQNAAQLLKLSLGIVQNARMIAMKVPAASPEVRQINDLVAKLQMKIKGSSAPTEPQAPPV